jgi:ATP-binding cassette subfamily B protein
VLAQQRKLVILDEPVSALDNKTEKSLMDTMLSTFAGKTLVIVAHRLRSIRDVDTIVLLRNGEIVGIGNFDSLMACCPYFRELWKVEEPAQLSDVR